MNVFRDAAKADRVWLPQEGMGEPPQYRAARYWPQERGRSEDADKIEKVLASWARGNVEGKTRQERT